MALATNAFQTTTPSADYINPEVWLNQIVSFAKAKIVMAPLGKKIMDLFNAPGDVVREQFSTEIVASELIESNPIIPSEIAYTQVTYTPTEYGIGIALTRKENRRSIQNIMMEKTKEMAYALAKKKDQVIFAALDAASGAAEVTPNGVDVSAITATDTMNTDVIADAIEKLESADREAKYLVIHPAHVKALRKLSNFIDASVYGGREVVLTGEIGNYLGIRVLVTSLVPRNATTSTARNAYLLDQDAFGIAYKSGITFNSDFDGFERQLKLSAIEEYGVSVRQEDKICRIVAYAG